MTKTIFNPASSIIFGTGILLKIKKLVANDTTILTCNGIILYPNKGEAKKKLPILKEANPTPANMLSISLSSRPGNTSEKD